jgi:outer membrane protein assembly factor BamB
MRRAAFVFLATLIVSGCSSSAHKAAPATTQATKTITRAARNDAPPEPAQRVFHLAPVRPGPLPGYLLIADRENNRALIVSPTKQVIWQATNLRGPDDAFFTPGFRSIITNEEFNDTLTELSIPGKQKIWRYGHDAVPGSSPGYLDTPDDAYRLPNGTTTIADIRNCRIVLLSHSKRVLRILGGSCAHDPPRGFASPNGDTPLPDGGLLVTEIGGWIDRLDAKGNLVWSVRSPVSYPSDAQLLPNGRILVCGFTVPGKIVELTRAGQVTWSFGAASGPNELAKPSLALRLPNGIIAANDDWNHRVILIDPRTKRIVWQYGHTGIPSASPGYLNKPDGLDLLPSAIETSPAPKSQPTHKSQPTQTQTRGTQLVVSRIGSLPRAASRLAVAALPDGHLVALGGLVGSSSSNEVLIGTPQYLVDAGHLPRPTHDDAAALVGGAVYLYGGGQAVSSPAVVRVDPRTGRAIPAGRLSEPLSDLGAVVVDGRAYLVGGYTGARYATAVLRMNGARMSVVARLPRGLRYAGVASIGNTIYVAGGLTQSGETAAIEAVDLSTGNVRRIGALPQPLAHAPLVAAGGELYLIGGRTAAGAASAKILRIDPANGATGAVGRLPQALADAAAVTVGSRVIVLGGAGAAPTNAVYSFTP